MRKQWRIWSLLILLALVTTWFLYTLDEKIPVHTGDTLNPDYTIKNFVSTHTDEKGYISSQLQAKNLIYYSKRKTQVIAPRLIFYEQAKPYWFVQAENGEISPNNEDIWLLGEVILWQVDENQQKRIEIISRNIHVNLNENYAESDAPTTILVKNGKIDSVGIKVFTTTQRVELLSQVRGHYAFK
jgi:LPS export ABC transporter protein LptC